MFGSPRQLLLAVSALVALATASAGRADVVDEAAVRHFETKVRPVLVEHCFKCHSAESKKSKGGLLLDTRDALLKGGDTGPAIVPGKADESLLIKAIAFSGGGGTGELQMPPKARLSDLTIADLRKWVELGAPWPAAEVKPPPTGAPAPTGNSAGADHWAFQPVRKQTPPTVKGPTPASTPIDQFIVARLQEKGLAPAPPADRRTLIRRATFDLIGLPPTPAEVEAFVNDGSPGAFERVVDRLLASPHYGERWGRHWLDLARYADTNGADENYAFLNAWRYRDYVFRAFNADKPYDRFLTEQIAGDLLPAAPDSEELHELLTATGFLVLGPKMLAEQDKPKLVMDLVDEQIDVVGQTFLGLTIGCARCHDHKFDPIPAADYYALAGIFKSTKSMEDLGFVSYWNEVELQTPALREAALKNKSAIAALKAEREALKKVAKGEDDQKKLTALHDQTQKLEREKPVAPKAMAVAEDKPQDVPIHIRGSHLTLAKTPTPRGFVKVLDQAVKPPSIDPSHSGRLELARWLADPANPLTARVMVNRIWQRHFGVGLVSTPSNFGLRGEAPSHPELLDWLANEFVAGGWSVKHMHRAIMLTSAYQMGSQPDARAAEIDPDNRLLWRHARRRLEAEPIRDALLAVTGDLDEKVGGPSGVTAAERYAVGKEDDDAVFQVNRRTVYLPIFRSRLHDLFSTFDYVDAGVHLPQRPMTTVPQQALFMLNNALVIKQADALAKKLPEGDDAKRIGEVYQRLFARPPTPAEVAGATEYLSALPPGKGDKRQDAWASLCRVLMASNEFVFVN